MFELIPILGILVGAIIPIAAFIMVYFLDKREKEAILEITKNIEDQYISGEIQQQIAQKFLFAQGRGCEWSSLPPNGHYSEGSPQEFIRNGISRDTPVFGCGCCVFKNIDTSLDSKK